MLTLGILCLLGIAFYSGARRGLAMQLVYSGGYFISYLVAQANYQKLAPRLELLIPYPSITEDSKMIFYNQDIALELDQAFYAAVAFLLILFTGWMITRFLAIFLRKLTFIPILKQFDWIAGGALCLIVAYVGIFLLLTVASYVPIDAVQHQFEASTLARDIVSGTPILTKQIESLWITRMIG